MPRIDPRLEKIIYDKIMPLARARSLALIGWSSPALRDPVNSLDSSVKPTWDEIARVLDDTVAGDQYFKALSSVKGYNQVRIKMAAKIQSELINMLERDWKSYKTSRIRAVGNEASRLARHGSMYGPLNRGWMQSVKAYLNEAEENPNGG